MVEPVPLDTGWLKAHPLPEYPDGVDKNGRGKVLVVGGSRRVPGGVLLTAEAAFRAGAGKVTIAAPASLAGAIGMAAPECAVIGMEETPSGEIARPSQGALMAELSDHDSVVVGPAMTDADAAGNLLGYVLNAMGTHAMLILDAAALRAVSAFSSQLAQRGGRTVMTPHQGELADMLQISAELVAKAPADAARKAARHYNAAVMAKGATSHLMEGDVWLRYAGGGVGLATGGSGDVLAGLIAALATRHSSPLCAAAWGIWLHGEAGRRLSETMGPLGFLARELAPLVPGLLRGV